MPDVGRWLAIDCMPTLPEPAMNASLPFSQERALRITASDEPSFNRAGTALRHGCLLRLDESLIESDAESCRSPYLGLPDGLRVLENRVIYGPAHSVTDGGRGLLLTYVHRHSPGGLHWRDSLGEAADLPPGALFISHTRHDALLELSPSEFGAPCDCTQWLLHAPFAIDLAADLAIRVAPDDVIFCNSNQACVRVLLGCYQAHAVAPARLPPMNLFDIDVAPLSEFELTLAGDREAIALLATGSLQVDGTRIEAPCALVFAGREPLALLSTQTGASLLWLDWQN